MFYRTYRSIKEIADVYSLFNTFRNSYLIDKTIFNFFHKIILNKEFSPFTIVDNNCYVLLKLSNVSNDTISIYDIKNIIDSNINNFFSNNEFLKKHSSLVRFNWESLWKEKVDYIEYQLIHLGQEYDKLLPILYYFIGMGENAIYYVNQIFTSSKFNAINLKNISLSHRRVCSDTKLSDFFNPFNIVIDHSSRDIAEYLKSCFINDSYDFNTIENFLNELNFNNLDYNLLFARLLFPSLFLDLYIDCINNNDLKKLLEIKERCDEYQLFLKNIYNIINNKTELLKIDWLIK